MTISCRLKDPGQSNWPSAMVNGEE